MDWDKVRRVLERVRWAVLPERRMTLAECQALLELAEAILDYGRMIQSHFPLRMDHVMVEVEELARRFRESPAMVEEALRLLRGMGRANAFGRGPGAPRRKKHGKTAVRQDTCH